MLYNPAASSMDACLQTREEKEEGTSLRLHVGGLGPSVISSDLLRTFSTLVPVSSVDIVRTKGRNFAYVTIQAASPRDIKRLFSLYNGCMWKGGRLKLEKAKEFYLEKLRREWAERDLLEGQKDPKCSQDKGKATSDCPSPRKRVPIEENPSGFNIYIPKLRKMKKIPDKGLGKHKRSFEWVEALPCSLLKLCSCREDCMTASNEQVKIREEPLRVAEKSRQSFNTAQAGVPCIEQSTANSKDFESNCEKDFVGKSVLNAPKGGCDIGVDPSEPIVNSEGLNETKGIIQESSDGEWSDEERDSNELVLNLKGIVQSRYGQNKRSHKKNGRQNMQKQGLACKEETQERERKRVKRDPDTCMTSVSRENEGVRPEDTVDSPTMQTCGLNELKLFKEPSGMNWVQKGSWKFLVGDTGRFSFRLGGMLDQVGESSSPLVGPSNGTVPSVPASKQSSSFEQDHQLEKTLLDATASFCSTPGSNGVVQGHLLSSHVDHEGTSFVKSDKSRQAWLQSKRAAELTSKRFRKDALRTSKLLH